MKALVLAAGCGSRLRPVTDDRPKCMVPVHGRPLLDSALQSLQRIGVDEAVLVVGYLADRIRDAYGTQFGNVRLTYVENVDYATTNNIYSLWLAREQLDDDVLLLESDLLLEHSIFEDLARNPAPDVAVAHRYQPFMDGTVVLADGNRAEAVVLKRDQHPDFDYSRALKTVNIYRFARRTLTHSFLPRLDAYVAAAQTGTYYEDVLADMVRDGELDLSLLRTGDRRWAEIDTLDDLRFAEELFSRTNTSEIALPDVAMAS